MEGEPLSAICEDEDMPARSVVYTWITNDTNGFSDKYARAREAQADTFADEIIHISDTATNIDRAKIQIDARKWYAGKVRPNRYGTKVDHTSSDGSMSPQPLPWSSMYGEPKKDDGDA
jgi:hypothetical protein